MFRVHASKSANYKSFHLGGEELTPKPSTENEWVTDSRDCVHALPGRETGSPNSENDFACSHPTAPRYTKESVQGLLAVSENGRYPFVAVVDLRGYLKVIPKGALAEKSHGGLLSASAPFNPILKLPLGQIKLLWGPPQHGLSLCVVVANVGVIIIRSTSIGEYEHASGNETAPHPSSWYEDRISTVDCESIDFESGTLCLPFSGSCSPAQCFSGRSSFTVVGAAFSPYSSDLLLFFQGRPAWKEHPATSLAGVAPSRRFRESCRAVLFRRGGNVRGTPPNTWVALKKSLKLLRDVLKMEENIQDEQEEGDVSGDNNDNERACDDAPVRNFRRRRASRSVASSETSVKSSSNPALFCCAAWHPQLKITSKSYTFDISVEKPAAVDCAVSGQERNENAEHVSLASPAPRCSAAFESNLSARVVSTCVGVTHPLSVIAIAGTDGCVRIIDVSLCVNGIGGELLVLDVTSHATPGNDCRKGVAPIIYSLDWGPRLGTLSPLVVTTAEHLVVFYLSFHCSTVTLATSTFGKKSSSVVRRRPHIILWASVEDYTTAPFRGLFTTEVPSSALSTGTVSSTEASNKIQLWPNASSAWVRYAEEETDIPFLEPEGYVPVSGGSFLEHHQQSNQVFGVSPVSFSGSNATSNAARSHNAADHAAMSNVGASTKSKKTQPPLLSSLQHAYETNSLVQKSQPKVKTVVSVGGQIPAVSPWYPVSVIASSHGDVDVHIPLPSGPPKLFRLVPPLRGASDQRWFPEPPSATRLQEWFDFAETHSDDNGVLQLSFSDAKCGRRKSAVFVGTHLTVPMSTQQLKETHRTLALIWEMNTNSEKGAPVTLSDKVFGFLVKTCRRITTICKEKASVQRSVPTDIQRVVKLNFDGSVSITTFETFQSAKVTMTKNVNLKPQCARPSFIHSLDTAVIEQIHFVRCDL